MGVKLKQLRVDAGMTQAHVAGAVGVSQPNYQRWEVGSAPIPEDKLKKLAKILKASPETILGKHAPIEAALYNSSVGEDLNYYGEVAVEFLGGGAPLLLSISERAFRGLYRDLQNGESFVTVESLANQTVAIRTQAIADLYFSSEAYDYCGPQGTVFSDYPDHIDILMPDARDWEIVEALDGGEVDEFNPADVKRVSERIMITDEQYAELVAEGKIKPEDLEKERESNQTETDRIFKLAHETTYQLSSGQRRSAYVDTPERLFNGFYELTDFDGGDSAGNDMILLVAEGRHRTIFINKSALDYVMIPTHKYIEGRIDATAEDLDAPKSTAKSPRKKVKLGVDGA